MNSDLRQVCDWLKLNQLTLNIKKSQFMLIGSNSRLRRIDSIVISADGKQLKEAPCFPYLGFISNQNLTWDRAPLAQLVEHRAVKREVVSSTPAGPTLRVLK